LCSEVSIFRKADRQEFLVHPVPPGSTLQQHARTLACHYQEHTCLQGISDIRIVGIDDRFGESGTHEQLLSHFGLTARGIASAVREVLSRKQPAAPAGAAERQG